MCPVLTRYEDRTAQAGRNYSYVVVPIEELATPTINDGTTQTHRAHVNGRANVLGQEICSV